MGERSNIQKLTEGTADCNGLNFLVLRNCEICVILMKLKVTYQTSSFKIFLIIVSVMIKIITNIMIL